MQTSLKFTLLVTAAVLFAVAYLFARAPELEPPPEVKAIASTKRPELTSPTDHLSLLPRTITPDKPSVDEPDAQGELPGRIVAKPLEGESDIRVDIDRLRSADSLGFARVLRAELDRMDDEGTLQIANQMSVEAALRDGANGSKGAEAISAALRRVRCSESICEIDFAKSELAPADTAQALTYVRKRFGAGTGFHAVVVFRTSDRLDAQNLIIYAFAESAAPFVASLAADGSNGR